MSIRYDRERGGAFIPIMRRKLIAPGSHATVVVLGELFRVFMHRVPNIGSLPCLDTECPFCPQKIPTEFRWYGAACRYASKTLHQPVIVEWWYPTVASFGSRVGNRPWRGLTVDYYRPEKSNEKMLITLAASQVDGILPPAFDIWPVLRNIWGAEYTFEKQEAPPE